MAITTKDYISKLNKQKKTLLKMIASIDQEIEGFRVQNGKNKLTYFGDDGFIGPNNTSPSEEDLLYELNHNMAKVVIPTKKKLDKPKSKARKKVK